MLLRLPYLKPVQSLDLKEARCLWPGLPVEAGLPDAYWQPEDYPLSPEQAKIIYAELAGLGIAELETMRLVLERHKLNDERNQRGELADLASFAGLAPGLSACDISRQQAQKTLLWAWLMEEQAAEISALEQSCNAAEQRISNMFKESPASANVASSQPPACSWRSILASAAWFMPSDMAILAEGEMLDDMLESLEFTPTDLTLHGCIAPIWRVLGRSRPYKESETPIAANLNTERRWFGRIDQ